MANLLDELTDDTREEGLDTRVIAKKIPVTVGVGSLIFEILLWVLGIIPGIVFTIMKIKAKNYFQQLEQKIQRNASQIDNYLEQRVVVLQNCARLLDRAIDLDKTTYENIARYRSGSAADADDRRAELAGSLDSLAKSVNIAFENYPDLQAHDEIRDAMQQNMYLQREITAARELYNDTVNAWNRDIFAWPTKMIVAARNGYTTRIPFIASAEIKAQAKGVFF
ncbi:MAG: LemA family protein [Ruminococcaceae bacterium]|nr:LemA family protein [Oscillospiraceae bacterium]